jgi:AraC-like DNA-binding protein
MVDLAEFAPLMHPPVDDPRLAALTGLHRGPAARRAGELVREISREAARAQPFAGLRLSGLALELVAELLRGRAAGDPGDAHAVLLEQAAERLRRLGERVGIADLADEAGLSPSHFRHCFARRFGASPRTYGRRARIRRAKELMVGSPLGLAEIARRVGFAEVHAFSKAFRAVEGIPPSAYRRCAPDARIRVEGRRAPYPH